MEARLQYLELREDANTRDILRLKTENVELRTKLHDCGVENSQISMRLKEVETKCGKLEKDFKKVYGLRGFIEEQLGRLESRITRVKDNEDRLSMLETAINEAQQEMINHNQLMLRRINELDQNRNVLSPEMEDMKRGIKQLKNINAQFSKTVVEVSLKPHDQVETNKFVELNDCVEVYQNGGSFNATSCVIDPKIDGDYFFCTAFQQSGEGTLRVLAKVEGEEIPIRQGVTEGGNMTLSCMSRVVSLKKGNKVCLVVVRDKGQANLNWCRFYCRLLL